MARFDVHANAVDLGYLLDVQADFLENLLTRVVVPVMPPNFAPLPAGRLNPILRIEGKDMVMVTQYLASVPRSLLQTPVTNLADRSNDIQNAIDFLIVGF